MPLVSPCLHGATPASLRAFVLPGCSEEMYPAFGHAFGFCYQLSCSKSPNPKNQPPERSIFFPGKNKRPVGCKSDHRGRASCLYQSEAIPIPIRFSNSGVKLFVRTDPDRASRWESVQRGFVWYLHDTNVHLPQQHGVPGTL